MSVPLLTGTAALLSTLLLASCTDNAPEQAIAPDTADTTATTPVAAGDAPYAEFNTSLTIREVMNALIDPSADALWNAVSFVVDESGSREVYPESEEEWARLRNHAISVVEGANSLMIPGREVAPAGSTTEYPDYEYLPDEVDALLEDDWRSWTGYAQQLQSSALGIIDAIDARDVAQLSERGGQMDQVCETCHSSYWYRASSL